MRISVKKTTPLFQGSGFLFGPYTSCKLRKSLLNLIPYPAELALYQSRFLNSQKATADAAATFSESTSCHMGMRTT